MRHHSHFWIQIPHEVHLKDANGWVEQGDEEYFVYRTHYYVKVRQHNEPARVGEKISVFESSAVPGRKWSNSHEEACEIADSNESLVQILQQEELKSGIQSQLQASINIGGITKASSALKSAIEQHCLKSRTDSKKTVRTKTQSTKNTFSWEFPIPDGSSEPWVAATMYQRFAYDVYLAWADFLFVRYQPTLFALRKTRFKYPEPPNKTVERKNWIKIHVPKFSLLVWELLPAATSVRAESEYVQELVDPLDAEIVPLNNYLSHTDPPRVSSLYELSNYCFPLKRGILAFDKKVPRKAPHDQVSDEGQSSDTEDRFGASSS